MIADWRKKFMLENMYFGFVQLAPWMASGGTLVAELRTGQMAALELPMVGMASAVDLGDLHSPFGSVHPRNKQTVGARLTATARALLYKQNLVGLLTNNVFHVLGLRENTHTNNYTHCCVYFI
jgi:sialate O-acetylesterase